MMDKKTIGIERAQQRQDNHEPEASTLRER